MEDTKTTQQPRQEASPSYVSAPGRSRLWRGAGALSGTPPGSPEKEKKQRIRLLQRRLIVFAVAAGIFLICFSLGAVWRGGRGVKLTKETITAQLAAVTELSQTSYHFTNVERFENIEDFYGWDASDSSKFTLSYGRHGNRCRGRFQGNRGNQRQGHYRHPCRWRQSPAGKLRRTAFPY